MFVFKVCHSDPELVEGEEPLYLFLLLLCFSRHSLPVVHGDSVIHNWDDQSQITPTQFAAMEALPV
jgi:hypothetical protein